MPHPNAKRTWIEWEVVDDSPEAILVIETDLETSHGRDGIDSSTMDDMIDEAKEDHRHPNLVIKRVRIVPVAARTG